MRSLLLAVCLLAAPLHAQNSGARDRALPSAAAARAGSAVSWRADLAAAVAEAKDASKPILWYVPTIRGSFMDRKPEIDRYMLAGPFSWPRLIALIESRFIPVRMAAGKEECEKYGLEPVGFIEPGFLILSADGAEVARVDRVTTHHPAWYEAWLAPHAGTRVDATNPFPGLLPVELARTFHDDAAGRELGSPLETRLERVPEERRAEALWLAGAGLLRSGHHDEARALWQDLVARWPESPLAWKAAMELEGHGPFSRGFEVYTDLPEAAAVPSGEGTLAPPGTYSAADLWKRGTRFITAMQRPNGGFDDSIYDFGGSDGLPNVYMAVTGVAAIALLEREARSSAPPAIGPEIEAERVVLADALERAFAFMADEANINSQDTDERIWAHIYRIRCLNRWLELRPDDAERVRPVLDRICDALVEMQASSGAWAHEYPNPFVTSSCLIALAEAERHDVEIEGLERVVAAATRSLLACRTENGAYTYGQSRPGRPVRADIEGSVGRTPLGEYALHQWDPEKSIGLDKAVALSFEHEHHLLPVRKYDDHSRNFAYGGFFFWYDIHARVEAIAALPAGNARTAFVQRQREQILGLPELDGAFVDSHEIGRVYGTGMALWCLAILERLE